MGEPGNEANLVSSKESGHHSVLCIRTRSSDYRQMYVLVLTAKQGWDWNWTRYSGPENDAMQQSVDRWSQCDGRQWRSLKQLH